MWNYSEEQFFFCLFVLFIYQMSSELEVEEEYSV